MLRYEASLPRLPVPTLSDTAAKYLESVQPHVTPSAYSETERLVKEFICETGFLLTYYSF